VNIGELKFGAAVLAVFLGVIAVYDFFTEQRFEKYLGMHPTALTHAISPNEQASHTVPKDRISVNLRQQWPRVGATYAYAVRFDGRQFRSRLVKFSDVATPATLNLIATDYRCGSCQRDVENVSALIRSRPEQDFLFLEASILGPDSVRLSEAVIQRSASDDFYAVHNRAFSHLPSTLAPPSLSAIELVERHHHVAESLGIKGTPTYIIDGKVQVGSLTVAITAHSALR
jgi:hypothetical protein